MKRSLLSLGLVCALVLAVALSGCAGSKAPAAGAPAAAGDASAAAPAAPAGGVTIQWWTPNWDEPESREMAAEFMEANSDVTVDLVITDWDTYKSKITTAISANNAPELYTVLITDVAPFAQKGFAEPLEELGKNAGIDFSDLLQPAVDIMTVNGSVYGIPFRYDGSGIYYNVDALSAAGYTEFPKTWDEMVEMSKKLATDGKYAFAWPLGNQANAATRLVQQVYTYGGDVLNADETKCLLDSDAAKKGLSNMVNSIQEGYASPNSAEYDNTKMRDAFGSGQLAFNFTGPFDLDTLKNDYPQLNFKTAVIPGDKGMGCTTANGWCIIMGSKAKAENKEAAAKFLAYLTTPENQTRLTDSFPASHKALEFERFATPELIPFAEQLANSKPEPTYVRWAEMEPIMFDYIQRAVAGTISVEDACNGMTKDIDTLLAS